MKIVNDCKDCKILTASLDGGYTEGGLITIRLCHKHAEKVYRAAVKHCLDNGYEIEAEESYGSHDPIKAEFHVSY